jgi:hypothetical protein
MAEINNPQLTSFCNNTLRPCADRFAILDSVMDAFIADFTAKGLSTIITVGGITNLITDGSETDGRTRLAGTDVNNMITFLQDFNSFMTTARRNAVLKCQVNGIKVS